MSQNSVSSVILRFSLDEASQRRVLRGIGDVEQVLSQTRRRVVSVEDAAAGMNAEFAELARAKAIDNLTADAIRAAEAADSWETSLKRVAQQLSLIGASDDEIKQVARSLAGAQSSARGGGLGEKATIMVATTPISGRVGASCHSHQRRASLPSGSIRPWPTPVAPTAIPARK